MSKSATRPTSGRNQRRLAAQKKRQQRQLAMLGGAVAVALFAVIGLIALNGRGGSSLGGVVAAATTIDAGIPRDGQTLGDPNAPVTVEVWSDYQCPYCKNFSENMLPQLVNDYVATGKVRVVYRDFAFIDRAISLDASGQPVVNGSGDSLRAAEAAAAAADQGRFWEYHTALFANQHEENTGAFTDDRLKEIARMVGLDMDQFNAGFDGHAHRAEVLSMYRTAVESGVDSTPTIVVNGQAMSVGMYAQLKEAIDAALAPAA
jgi:protein-disulfide isomerase